MNKSILSLKEYIGKKYSYLTILKYFPGKRSDNIRIRNKALCLCKCGNDVKSCGCYKNEIHTKHGFSSTKEYSSWKAMMERCTKINHHNYPSYGGRGIKICKRWFNVQNFIKDMGKRPEGYTLGRINNDGNYKPSNCRWETISQQNSNKRKKKLKGITKECLTCQKPIYVRPFNFDRKKFCSKKCLHTRAIEKRGTNKKCKSCDKIIYITPQNKNRKKYCSLICKNKNVVRINGKFQALDEAPQPILSQLP